MTRALLISVLAGSAGLLAGCAAPADLADLVEGSSWLPFDASAPPAGPIDRDLVLAGPTQVEIGQVLTLSVAGAEPGQAIRIWGSLSGPGTSTQCPKQLNYNCVELLTPITLRAGTADAVGNATVRLTVPTTLQPGTLTLQATALRDVNRRILPNLSPVIAVELKAPCADEDWWAGADLDGDGTTDLPYRVLLAVTGSSQDQAAAPIYGDVDFRAALDALGVFAPFDPDSVRFVRQSCDLGFPEVPGQWIDGLRGLRQKVDHTSPLGDEAGAVVLLADEDGDIATQEQLDANEDASFAVYFATGAGVPARTWPTDLSVQVGATVELANSRTSLSLDPARGGLMSDLQLDASGPLSAQATSCCGNGMHFWNRATQPGPPFGWIVPAGAPGDVEVIADGPVVAVARSTGQREAITNAGVLYGAYTYEVLYWLFAGRPEVWHSVLHVTTADSTTEHEFEASFAFRPVQLRHTAALTTDATWDTGTTWGAITSNTYGLGFATYQPPAELADISNPPGPDVGAPPVPEFSFIRGNEVVPPGVLSPVTVPAGTAIFDNVGVVMLPYEGTFAANEGELMALLEGVDAYLYAVEREP